MNKDYVKVYRERFCTLWTVLKNFYVNTSSCNKPCRQGRNCDCIPKKNLEISDCIIQLHALAGTIEDPVESLQIRKLADELAKIGNRLQEKN
jgi:hypothetical protein